MEYLMIVNLLQVRKTDMGAKINRYFGRFAETISMHRIDLGFFRR